MRTRTLVRVASFACLRSAKSFGWILLFGLSACREPAKSQWTHFADGYEPRPHYAGEVLFDNGSGLRVLGDRSGGMWVETKLQAEDWVPGPFPGTLGTYRPLPEVGIPIDGSSPTRVVYDGREATWIDPDSGLQDPQLRRPGVFSSINDLIFLCVAEGEAAPREAVLSTYVTPGFADGELWYARLGGLSGTGFLLLPGFEERLLLERGGAAQLRLTFAAQRYESAPPDPVTLKVSLDGVQLARYECVPERLPQLVDVVVDLPDGAAKRSVTLVLEGPMALCAVLEPRVRWEPVTPAQRPADVVVFLADTFRADNLRAYRGSPAGVPFPLTPNLDELAEQSIVYRAAWSPCSWTLPAHASLFTSLWPTQHGAGWQGMQLATSALTLAESLRRQGYRTLAITDGGFCSESMGLAQGFDLWYELPTELDKSLALFEQLAASDDGRPRFVFVQTYRTHSPYLVSDASRSELREQFEMPADDESARMAMLQAWADWKAGGQQLDGREGLDRRIEQLATLYHGAVRDFDRAFASWLSAFDRHELGDRGDWLVFTSDHGEALGEQDQMGHATGIFESQTRIPLLVRGPTVEHVVVDQPVSLVDVAPALLHWLGLPAEQPWLGRRLDPAPRNETDIFLTAKWLDDENRQTGRLSGRFKSIVQAGQGTAALVDLAEDPLELRVQFVEFDPLEDGAVWPVQSEAPARIFDTTPARLLEADEELPMGRHQLEHLRNLGYGEMLED